MLRTVPAGEFKQHCLALMDQVAISGEEMVVTKYGKPVCRIAPLTNAHPKKRFGKMKGTVVIHGDITLPIDSQWNAAE